MALKGYFSDETEAVPNKSFADVFKAVLEGSSDYGIVPVENSLAGSIHENYDLLLQNPDIQIVGETKIRIIHSLIGVPDAEIDDLRKVFSHPQGLAQCRSFFEEHPAIERVPFYDTAGSVAFVAREGRKEYGAIANEEAARIYGVKVLKIGIETNPRNYTRFVILSREEKKSDEIPNKASLVFSTPDNPVRFSSA